jgi:DNA polymerase-3 subunit epsilon
LSHDKRAAVAGVALEDSSSATVRDVTTLSLAPRIIDADREAQRAIVATPGDKPILNNFLGAA